MSIAPKEKQTTEIEKVEQLAHDNGEIVSEEEWEMLSKSVRKKLDMTLMPTIWVLYLFNYLDRNNIA